MKKLTSAAIILYMASSLFPTVRANAQNSNPLQLDANAFTTNTIQYPTGETINYRSYENIYYVANVADSAYQTLNIYIPESVYRNNSKTPVFLKTNVGGYMASRASAPSTSDATGRALLEGYVVVIPGARGSNSTITAANGSTVWAGRAPAGLIDLKAAIRYLRYNKDRFPGDTEKIITDGTSAGGAMSALLGATGNYPVYEPYLEELGAAVERDDIFAAVCYCPITDLDHADMAYEWLYQSVSKEDRGISDAQAEVSKELAARFPAYLNSLELRKEDGTPLTDANYLDYVKSFLIQSAQRARNEGFDIPDSIGIRLNNPNRIVQGDINRRRPAGRPMSKGEIVTDIDLNAYLKYVNSQRRLKTPPAFDALGVAGAPATAENNVFGNAEGTSANFTVYSLQKATGRADAELDQEMQRRVYLMNPMNFIGGEMNKTAPNWYIRHGALDRDTAFPVPINLYTRLVNGGYNVDFFLPWNRNHSGDYNLDDLFRWIRGLWNKPAYGKKIQQFPQIIPIFAANIKPMEQQHNKSADTDTDVGTTPTTISRHMLKKQYRLIMAELPRILPIAYLIMIAIGMIFNYYKYNLFGINIFQYASVFDFLVAPFEDYIIILFILASLLLSCLVYVVDYWTEKKWPRLYRIMSFNTNRKKHYGLVRFYLFAVIILAYTWMMAVGYGIYARNEVLAQPDIHVVYYNNDTAEGKQIGKTSDVLFLLDADGITKAIPLNTSVKEVQYNAKSTLPSPR